MLLSTIFVFRADPQQASVQRCLAWLASSIARVATCRAISKCVDCHGDDLGDQVVFDALPMARWLLHGTAPTTTSSAPSVMALASAVAWFSCRPVIFGIGDGMWDH
jgi:hypothetical protein